VDFESESFLMQDGVYRRCLILFGSVGIFLRIVLVARTMGSNDVFIWTEHAKLVATHGVQYAFANSPMYNHPPLMGYWAALATTLARDPLEFARWLKIPGLLGDIGSSVLIYRIYSRRSGPLAAAQAFTAYAWGLCAILVSGYHGNTDALVAFFSLLSVYLLDARERPFWSGLALALALNVKIIPLLIVPCLVLSLRSRRHLAHWTMGLALGIIPYIPFLMTVAKYMKQNMISYNSNPDNWGILAFLNAGLSYPAFAVKAAEARAVYLSIGRYIVIGLIAAMSLAGRLLQRWSRYELAAISYAIFLVFAPGFGVQYTIILAPLLFAVSIALGWMYATLAGFFIGSVYYAFLTIDDAPRSVFTTSYPVPTVLVGVLAWGYLFLCLIEMIRGRTERSRAGPPISSVS